jgi:hypothetical protein
MQMKRLLLAIDSLVEGAVAPKNAERLNFKVATPSDAQSQAEKCPPLSHCRPSPSSTGHLRAGLSHQKIVEEFPTRELSQNQSCFKVKAKVSSGFFLKENPPCSILTPNVNSDFALAPIAAVILRVHVAWKPSGVRLARHRQRLIPIHNAPDRHQVRGSSRWRKHRRPQSGMPLGNRRSLLLSLILTVISKRDYPPLRMTSGNH